MPLPQTECLVRRTDFRAEIGCLVFTEEDFYALELLAVADGNGDFDLDRGCVFVGYGTADASAEGGAGFFGG